MYFGPPCYGYALPSCLFGNTRNTSVMLERARFVCFIYMQPQKVKFKSVQINMKQVSYVSVILISISLYTQNGSPNGLLCKHNFFFLIC